MAEDIHRQLISPQDEAHQPLPPSPAMGITAGTRLWRIPELQSMVLDRMGRGHQARAMRVERRGVALAAGKVYRKVYYEYIEEATMSESAERAEIYLQAIRVVDCYLLSLDSFPSELREQLGHLEGLSLDEQEEWLYGYQPELLKILIPSIRQLCSNVHTLEFGNGYRGFCPGHTTITLARGDGDEAADDLESSSGDEMGSSGEDDAGTEQGLESPCRDGLGSGHIRQIYTRTCRTGDRPPSIADVTPILPSPNYTINSRFDLLLKPELRTVHPIEAMNLWLAALSSNAKQPIFNNLYRAIDLGNLPVSFEMLRQLYVRQRRRGYKKRLRIIIARSWRPPLQDFASHFGSFAIVASKSLRCLILAWPAPPRGGRSLPSFAMRSGHLLILVSYAHQYLPNLMELEFAVDLPETDRWCKAYLPHTDVLSLRGSVRQLRVHASGSTHPLNLGRYLSVLLAEESNITLIGETEDVMVDHSAFIKYLRGQSTNRRHYLKDISFRVLGVRTASEVLDLTYDLLGRPEHMLDTQIQRYLQADSTSRHESSLGMISALEEGRQQLARATAEMSDAGAPERTLAGIVALVERLRMQLKSVETITEVSGLPVEILEMARRVSGEMSASIEAGVQVADKVRAMKAAVQVVQAEGSEAAGDGSVPTV